MCDIMYSEVRKYKIIGGSKKMKLTLKDVMSMKRVENEWVVNGEKVPAFVGGMTGAVHEIVGYGRLEYMYGYGFIILKKGEPYSSLVRLQDLQEGKDHNLVAKEEKEKEIQEIEDEKRKIAEKAEKSKKRFEELKNIAKQTGVPQELSSTITCCNDENESCDLDTVIKYIMPSGMIYTERIHNY
jgi:hypothetical protein